MASTDSDNNGHASVVISGVSGRFPNAENVEELWKCVLTARKTSAVNGNGSNFDGKKLKNDPKQFDAEFFGLLSSSTSGNVRQLLEVIYEAILDSGTSYSELYQQKIGLILISPRPLPDSDAEVCDRIATVFKFQGPTFMFDDNDSSCLRGLQSAFDAIQSGECERAIVAGINLHTTTTAVEDEEAAEAKTEEFVAAVMIQKRSQARREYLRIVEGKTVASVIASGKAPEEACERQNDFVGLIKLILNVQHGVPLAADNPTQELTGVVIKQEQEQDLVQLQSGEAGTGTGMQTCLALEIPPKAANVKRVVSPTPVLIPMAGRTKEGVHDSMQKILFHPRNSQFDSLLQKIAEGDHASNQLAWSNPVRGYLVRGEASVDCSYKEVPTQKMPLWLIFSGTPGSLWPGMANDLIKIKIFADSIQKSTEILRPFGVDLHGILIKGDAETLDRYLGIGYIAMGIAFIDLLLSIGVEADGYIGHSGGELLCAYLDGCLSHEEALVSYYWKDECVQSCLGGTMASVALTWEQAKKKCPPWIYPACHNAKNNVTIAGLAKDVPAFLAELRAEGVLGMEVNSAGVAYHTRYLKPMLAEFESKLREVIKPENIIRQRSKRFLSTSIPEKDWAKNQAEGGGDMVDYIVNNIRNPVLFHPVLKHIPHHSAVIEVSPNAHMIAILEKALGKTCAVWGLEKQDGGNNAAQLLAGIGKLYEHGFDLKVSSLYPEPSFPVQIGTPMISPLVTWNHAKHD